MLQHLTISPTSRRRASALLLLSLTASVLTAVGTTPAAHAQPLAAPATTADDASAQAAATGQPVEVTSDTTETTQVMANPDGSFTLTSNRDPVRVQQDSQWTPIDTTLTASQDGSLSPRATTAGLTFSGGGSGPALTIADPASGNTIAFSWPTPLPAPTLDGDSATYPGVLPGVDLQLTAHPDSYSEVLVVHDAAAAANPALHQLTLTATATGLTLSKSADGGLSATDATGNTVFAGVTPTMWDSTTNPQVGPTPSADDPGGAAVTPLPISVPTTDGTDGDASATITMTPPADALTGPQVQYPVYIDPVLSTPNRQHYAVALSAGASYYDDPTQDMKVGYCGWADCNGIGAGRSYFNFNTTDITRHDAYQVTTAHIFAAEVDARETHNALGCTAEPVDLWSAGGISASTSYPGPTVANLQTVSSNLSDTCSSAPPGIIRFSGPNVLARVQSAANSGTTVLTFGLLAANDTDKNLWKRFDTSPTLIVTYNFPPSGATATGVTGAVSCNGRLYTSDSTPTINGKAHDNNDPHTGLDLRFHVYPTGSATPQVTSSDVLASTDAVSSYAVGSALADGDYQYSLYAHFSSANFYIDMQSAESARYAFTVLHQPPAAAPTISSADYPPNYWGNAADQGGQFNLSTNAASNAVGLVWAWDNNALPRPDCAPGSGDQWAMATAGNASIPVLPSLQTGRHTLTVANFDGAGNTSTTSSYTFYIAPATGSGLANRIEAEDSIRLSYGGSTTATSMLNFNRYNNGVDHASVTAAPTAPTAWKLEVPLGYLAADPITGTSALYDCTTGTDRFTSLHADCEGKTRVTSTTMGYIYTTAPASPPTHPIYRCLASEHFDSLHADCEGQITEFLIGYALNTAATGTPNPGNQSSGNALKLIPTTSTGQTFTMTFTAPVTADYALGTELFTDASNGTIDFSISDLATPTPHVIATLGTDGTPGATVDGYSATAAEKYVQLGGAHFDAGTPYQLIGTIHGAGTGGGYQAALDYLTVAPITNLAAVPNNHGITDDGSPTGYQPTDTTTSLDGNGNYLSRQALTTALATAPASYAPGQTITVGPATFRIPNTTTSGMDNITAHSSVLHLNQQVSNASHLYLLVASTGGPTPDSDHNYFLTTIDNTDTFTDHELPTIPDWTTSDPTTTTATGTGGATRTPAADLPYYDQGTNATQINTHVYLYLLDIPITTPQPLTDLVLPAAASGTQTFQLHVLAETIS